MSRLITGIIVFLFLTLISSHAVHAATYYIGPDACDPNYQNNCTGLLGSDVNDGLSRNTPWKSFGRFTVEFQYTNINYCINQTP